MVDPARPGAGVKRLDRLTRGAVTRLMASDAFGKLKDGEGMDLTFPAGLEAEAVQVIRLDRKAGSAAARKAGAAIGRALSAKGTLVLADTAPRAADVSFGLAMRAYDFNAHKTAEAKADALERDAQEKHRVAMGSLESARATLERKVEDLRGFEREYRTRLKSYLESQLRQLETQADDSLAPPRTPATASGGQVWAASWIHSGGTQTSPVMRCSAHSRTTSPGSR